MNELTEYQKQIIELLNSDNVRLLATRTSSKSLFDRLKDSFPFPFPDYVKLEDHWEYPGLIRVDVIESIGKWIESHDVSSWTYEACVGDYERYAISPELYTLMVLKFNE